MIAVYTDGAASPDGQGGWAWCTETDQQAGHAESTTNQRMELQAAIMALRHFAGREVAIHSDSAYLVNCFLQQWYVRWQANGWRNSNGGPVANADLWSELIVVAQRATVRWVKVRGHDGVPLNERADALAVMAKDRPNCTAADDCPYVRPCPHHDYPESEPDVEEFHSSLEVVSLGAGPCPVCSAPGPCGYDAEGRALIHAVEADGDD